VRKRIIILGAAGRDFHNFNVVFRENPDFEVVAFTATQIPYIADRMYPKELSGKLYPKGIKIYEEKDLPLLIKKFNADACILSYSDLSFDTVMQKATLVNASGADFWLLSPEHTMLKSTKPVIAVCAVRTGCGKSQTTRYIALMLKKMGLRVVLVRHPMPYGDLREQVSERFAAMKDLDRYKCTIEEREEYELPIKNGLIMYAGVDYEKILRQAEKEADVIIWDGGNNDTPFYKPDLFITVTDPLRAGNEVSYYPGATAAIMADVIVMNKVNSATKDEIAMVTTNIRRVNPHAKLFYADSIVRADSPSQIKGKKVLVVEDGPTITHGNMRFGAGTVAARQYGASDIVTAKDFAVGSIKETFEKYPNLDKELPAMGYSAKQIKDLEATINGAVCDSVVSATPTNLRNLINSNKPIVLVSYELSPKDKGFDSVIKAFADKIKK
jgi:predicted GTPase